MEECPRLEEEDPFSFWLVLMDVLTVICLAFNAYLMYCIVYCSTSHMKTYRWYLLWHQAVATFTDFAVNFLSKPIIFMPFQGGYCAGPVRWFIPTSVMAAVVLYLLGTSLSTVCHLFIYRYLTITQRDRFPLVYKIRVAIAYFCMVFVGIQEYRAHIDDAIVINSLKPYYSCIGDYLLEIKSFLIFDQDIVYEKTAAAQIIMVGIFLFETGYCTYFSWRATSVNNMSRHLAQLQRRFLIQLLVQTLVPFMVLCIPMITMAIVMRFKIFNLSFVGRITTTNFGSFSLIGGITLIVMNANYQAPAKKLYEKIVKPKIPDPNIIRVQSQTVEI